MTTHPIQPGFGDLYLPKLVTILREGYGLRDLRADVLSGLTVAIVALPLSMAIAIASGVTPERGLYTSIVGGFIVSALGGSRFQIGGPAGAFIGLVSATLVRYGLDGLLLATMMSGAMLLAVGLLRLGTFVKYIPYPVTVGFTAGIAVIIFASQIRDLLGLSIDHEPGPLMPKLAALADALPTANPSAIVLAVLTIAVIAAVRRFRPHWPAFIIAVALTAVLAAAISLPVETIGTRFGGIPRSLPMPHLPPLSWARIAELLPAAASFALLGCIESLLSAVVADSMTGRRHRSNGELVAQGLANLTTPLFGGFCVTGNIARTATNVRSGARGPVSGMFHSALLLLFMLIAAPLAAYIPLAALAGVLGFVAWNMAEKQEFALLLRNSRGDAVVLLVTFLLVIFRDLTEGILAGFGIGALLFLHRMASAVEVEESPYDAALTADPDIVICRISGAFFFGAAAAVGAALDRIGDRPKACIVDFSGVFLIDSSAAVTIEGFLHKAVRRGATVFITGASAPVRRRLLSHGVRPPRAKFRATLDAAITDAREETKSS